jgi:AraC family transcriptional regulator, transcriptional activator of pobA
MGDRIYHTDLLYEGKPASFVIKTMESIDDDLQGAADDPHRHNYYTVIWPFTGSGRHIIDFITYPIVPDHIFFVSPNQVHQVIVEDHPTGVVLQFTCEFLEKFSIREEFISNLRIFSNSDETPPLPLAENLRQRLKLFTDSMLQVFHGNGNMQSETLGAWLKLFLIECNTHCSLFPEPNPQQAEVGRNLVRNFKDQVEKHFARWHQVQKYADALNVTPGYLNEVIKTSIGQSAKEYIQSRLILEARRMSLFTTLSNKEIGYSLGFNDPAHFSRFFKSQAGMSLQEFRNPNTEHRILNTKSGPRLQ